MKSILCLLFLLGAACSPKCEVTEVKNKKVGTISPYPVIMALSESEVCPDGGYVAILGDTVMTLCRTYPYGSEVWKCDEWGTCEKRGKDHGKGHNK